MFSESTGGFKSRAGAFASVFGPDKGLSLVLFTSGKPLSWLLGARQRRDGWRPWAALGTAFMILTSVPPGHRGSREGQGLPGFCRERERSNQHLSTQPLCHRLVFHSFREHTDFNV